MNTSSASASAGGLPAQVIRRTNLTRLAHGRRRVRSNAKLRRAAQGHASDMAAHGPFSHTSANGRTWDLRIRRAGFTNPGGENIAYGQTSAAAVVAAWMGSPEHRANMLDRNFRFIGVGYASDGRYWVQDFGY